MTPALILLFLRVWRTYLNFQKSNQLREQSVALNCRYCACSHYSPYMAFGGCWIMTSLHIMHDPRFDFMIPMGMANLSQISEVESAEGAVRGTKLTLHCKYPI